MANRICYTRDGDAQVRPAALVTHGLLARHTPPWSPRRIQLTEAVIRLIAVMAGGRPGGVVGAWRLLSAEPVISVKEACEGAASPRAGIFPPRAVTSAHRTRSASFRPGERTSATEEVVMPDRHFELPAHPDLEYYRKQAKQLLRSYEAGDAAARDRAAEVLGDRAAGRFLLSDAQFVLAQEHGFRTWAEFRADIQSQRATGDRPVSRLWGRGAGDYASWADSLLTELRRGDPGALR